MLALALPMLVPAGSAYASVITLDSFSESDKFQVDWGSYRLPPPANTAPKTPDKHKPFFWSWFCGLPGSMGSSGSSNRVSVTYCDLDANGCFVFELIPYSERLCLAELPSMPTVEPDVPEKIPKPPVV